MFDAARKFVGEKVVTQAVRYLGRDPEENIEKVIDLADKLAVQDNHKQYIQSIRRSLLDPDSNWHELYINVMSAAHPRVRERLTVNFVINASLFGIPKQVEMSQG